MELSLRFPTPPKGSAAPDRPFFIKSLRFIPLSELRGFFTLAE